MKCTNKRMNEYMTMKICICKNFIPRPLHSTQELSVKHGPAIRQSFLAALGILCNGYNHSLSTA